MISKEEAIKCLTKKVFRLRTLLPLTECAWLNEMQKEVEVLNMAIEALSQPERPKGRWVEGYDFDWLKFMWSCDQCGEDAPTKPESCDQILKPFCPNCGADMRGEEE